MIMFTIHSYSVVCSSLLTKTELEDVCSDAVLGCQQVECQYSADIIQAMYDVSEDEVIKVDVVQIDCAGECSTFMYLSYSTTFILTC